MFQITEADAADIREIHRKESMLAAVLELQARYPEIPNQSVALEFVRSLVIWEPLPGLSGKG